MSTIRANTILDAAGGNTATINGITPALASQAQAEAGTDNTTLMTPLRTAQATLAQFNVTGTAPTYACRAWVRFNGTGTVAIDGSGNVSSITDNGTGDYTVNFTTAMPDANYSAVGMPASGYGLGILSMAAGSVRVRTPNFNNTAVDSSPVCVSIFR